ncbi:Detected protein of unknown function [Hibiscus syriacus]|uniref:Uncharacterized protein n=1 Tax=Hibiscus syriacus TaxID=106335 RepID=A0A6A3C1V7_HIBSY|nr:uncharacterized protein LOC120177566 [Hibiscus syriacus]XP_039061539.1 uncharacterized protein LOC120205813 [Hibiscus syriacus]KAE8723110.1 Detected protein of unknown function [Hibiscus syriacus]
MASKAASPNTKSHTRTCLCSPTKHPGSFKCSQHRRFNHPPAPVPARRATAVRAWSNYRELVLIAGANPHRAFLLQGAKPSRSSAVNTQRRRNFQPKLSRFYLLNANRNGLGVSVS